MKNFKIIFLVLLISTFCYKANAQVDPHFSQYYSYPILLNPALTGVTDGEYRMTLNAKQQWSTINDGYRTAAASFDFAPKKNLAFGATVINQSAGEVGINYLNALISSSYRLRLGNQGFKMISFGLQAGLIQKKIDLSNAKYGSQFNSSIGYDPGMSSYESFSETSSTVPDINFGLVYFDGDPYHKVNVFAGFAASHLSRPVDEFLGSRVNIPIKYTIHGGARIRITDDLDLTPNAMFMTQGNAEELSAGVYAQLMLNQQTDLLFGTNFRMKDAVIGFLGLQIKNMVIGLSYDLNTSSLNKASNRNGGFELSFSFTKKRDIVKSDFIYPRI